MPNNTKPEDSSRQPQPANIPLEPTPPPTPDTAPDDTVGTDADTDTPIDREVVNDAVLRGEDKPQEPTPSPDTKEPDRGLTKMNTDKK
jgi:hypothetical protein